MSKRAGQALLSWNYEGSGSMDKNRWKIVPVVIWWTIWKVRNSRCFESVSSLCIGLKQTALSLFAIGVVWNI